MDTIIPLRHCNKCGNDWPATLDYFFADNRRIGSGFRSPCKKCIKEYRATPSQKESIQASQKKHYQANTEQFRQYAQNYNSEHREEIRARARQRSALRRAQRPPKPQLDPEVIRERKRQSGRRHYALHREKNRQYGRQYHALNREKRLLYNRQYDATHKEERRQYQAGRKAEHTRYMRGYRDLYREEDRARVRQRRARRMDAPGTMTHQQIQQKLKSQKYACYYCFTKFEKKKGKYVYHLDHTIPLSRTEWGPRHDENYTVLACPTCNMRKSDKLPHEWEDGDRLF